jgi:hypothetical protein
VGGGISSDGTGPPRRAVSLPPIGRRRDRGHLDPPPLAAPGHPPRELVTRGNTICDTAVRSHVEPTLDAPALRYLDSPVTRRSRPIIEDLDVIDDTVDELRAIARSCDDASGYFPAMYARVTAQIAAAVRDDEFADGKRMQDLAVCFARRYTAAWHRQVRRPACWQASWDVAGDANLLIVQHLLLGINAHVNYDLPQAVVEIARRHHDLTAVRADFDAVNDVLAATSIGVVRDLDRVSRWVSEIASLGGGRLFNFSLRVARHRAWDAAQRLYALDPDGEHVYIADLDRLVSVITYLIANPPRLTGLAVRVARRFEEHDPQVVITALLADT